MYVPKHREPDWAWRQRHTSRNKRRRSVNWRPARGVGEGSFRWRPTGGDLKQLAEELEREAAELERQAAMAVVPVTPSRTVIQMQQQPQLQQDSSSEGYGFEGREAQAIRSTPLRLHGLSLIRWWWRRSWAAVFSSLRMTTGAAVCSSPHVESRLTKAVRRS